MKYMCVLVVALLAGHSLYCQTQRSTRDSLNQIARDRSRWREYIEKIGEAAMHYRYRPTARGGGGDSYIGFMMPEGCDSSEYGSYSILDVFPEKVVLQANLPFNKSPLAVHLDSIGIYKKSQWIYEYEMDKIAAYAYQYRLLPISEGGGGGSYEGFKIPPRDQWTPYGRYTLIKIQPEEIIIRGNCSTERLTRDQIYHANGKRHELNDFWIEVKQIVERAYQYRTRPFSQGGGQGSYIGFTLLNNSDSTSCGKYVVHDIQPDELVLKVLPRSSRNWYIFVFDSLGKQKYDGFQQHEGIAYWENYRAIIADIKQIGSDAAQYWRKTRSSRSVRSSFDGFMVPDTLAKTANGSYSITEMRDDTLYIRAVSSKGYGEEYFLINAQGNQQLLIFGEYRPPKVQPKRIMPEDAQTMYKHAVEQLNKVYQQLLVRNKSDERFIKNLRTAERLWIKYRNAQFKGKYPQQVLTSDGSKLTKSQLSYLTVLTEKRLRTLQELVDQP
jgi:uncharacterized protein YecT (DUF1311 family)